MLTVRPSRFADVTELSENLREADIQEIKASSGVTPLSALSYSFLACEQCLSIVNELGEICGMFGAGTYDKTETVHIGMVWMLASPKLLRYRKQFIRECKSYIDQLMQHYDVLFNLVDERNEVHIRWIQWSGFTITKRYESFGVEKRPFLEFIKTKHV